MDKECQRFYKEGFDHLLKTVITEIERTSNKDRGMKENFELTAMNVAHQDGVVKGAFKVLKLIDKYASTKSS